MFSDNGKISLRQFRFIIVSGFTVFYMLILPYFFIKESIYGISLKFFLSFLLSLGFIYFLIKYIEKKKIKGGEKTLRILCGFIFAKTLVLNGFFLQIINSAEVFFLCDGKNSAISIFILALFSFYVCVKGIETAGRLAELTGFFIIFVVAATAFTAVFKCDIFSVKQTFTLNENFAYDTIKIIPFLLGAEGIFFVLPYVEEKETGKSFLKAYIFVAAAVIFITAVATGFFGEKLMCKTMWQNIELMKNMSFGFLPQRKSIMFTGVLLFGVAMYWAYTVFLLSECMKKVLPSLKSKTDIFFSATALCAFVMIFEKSSAFISYGITAFLNILSILLLAFYILKYGGIGR